MTAQPHLTAPAAARPLSFGHHALAVLGAAMLGATALALVFASAVLLESEAAALRPAWMFGVSLAVWLGVFVVALPGAAVVLSLLWPVTRRGTAPGAAIAVLGCIAAAIVLAPLASPGARGASVEQMLAFVLVGAVVAGSYLLMTRRFRAGPRMPAVLPAAPVVLAEDAVQNGK